jgi:hypothetical protein
MITGRQRQIIKAAAEGYDFLAVDHGDSADVNALTNAAIEWAQKNLRKIGFTDSAAPFAALERNGFKVKVVLGRRKRRAREAVTSDLFQ